MGQDDVKREGEDENGYDNGDPEARGLRQFPPAAPCPVTSFEPAWKRVGLGDPARGDRTS